MPTKVIKNFPDNAVFDAHLFFVCNLNLLIEKKENECDYIQKKDIDKLTLFSFNPSSQEV